jgi:hypothetical protein
MDKNPIKILRELMADDIKRGAVDETFLSEMEAYCEEMVDEEGSKISGFEVIIND